MRLKLRPAYTPLYSSLISGSTSYKQYMLFRFIALTCAQPMPAMYREPLCLLKVLPLEARCSPSCRKALPFHHRSYGLMSQTKILLLPSVVPRQQVFAGCCQPLLEDGLSRCYLRNPCIGVSTPTPWRPFGALARFFPKGCGFTSEVTGSARQMTAAKQLQRRNNFEAAVIPLCSNSYTC